MKEVTLVDAVSSGAAPGTTHRVDVRTQAVPPHFRPCSTHAFGVGKAIELARVLNKLPPWIIFFGVEGNTFELGAPLSDAPGRAARQVVR